MEEPQVFGTPQGISKVPTGIQGLDELTGGGPPRGRSTVVIGTAGSGKTVFAMQYIVKGALESAEPGVFVSFDESADKLSENFVSIGWDLKRMQEEGLVAIDTILFDPTDLMRAGALDLKALFLRIVRTAL